jgi:hypothetical protein
MPKGHLHGLVRSNDAGDTAQDINVTAGEAQDTANGNNITLASEITKKTDATWAAGDDAGGMASGVSLTNGMTLHVHVILNPTSGAVDVGFDSSVTAANLLADAVVVAAGFTKYRRIGSIVLTAGATTVRNFTQYPGGEFWPDVPVLDVSATNPGTSAVTETLASVPTGVKMKAIMNVFLDGGANACQAYLSSLDTTDAAPSDSVAPLGAVGFIDTGANDGFGVGHIEVWTNTSAQIRSRLVASDSSTRLEIVTLGWVDPRGMDD